MLTLAHEDNFDILDLNKKLDRTMARVFMGRNASFLAPLMTKMDFHWTNDPANPTAATDGLRLWWDVKFFLKLDDQTRETVLVHELWHVAHLHMVRKEHRDSRIWNWACDIRINNDLKKMGYVFHNFTPWEDMSLDIDPVTRKYEPMVEEKIYEKLKDKNPTFSDLAGDMLDDLSESDAREVVRNVVTAKQQAEMYGDPTDVPAVIADLLDKFLTPIIPWEKYLYKFFEDLLEEDYSWARPNRRYTDMYLPSREADIGKLQHLIYYLDVSGSVTNDQVMRFNSEVRYIKKRFKPERLTLCQFDTRITSEITFEEHDEFEELQIIGRGGTSLVPVRNHMIEHNPTAAIIFSDFYCAPMEELPIVIPTLWVAIDNSEAKINFGNIIHIRN